MERIVTDDDFWDCGCEDKYIHSKKEFGTWCIKCNTHADEQPDSRVNEIKYLYKPEEGWL